MWAHNPDKHLPRWGTSRAGRSRTGTPPNLFKVSVPMVQRSAAGFPSLKKTVDLRKAWMGGYFPASSTRPCTWGAVSSKKLNYLLPHATDSQICGSRMCLYTKLLLPQYPYPKKTQNALQEISEGKCWWSAFLKQSQWFHIWNLYGCNADWSWGIPSVFLWKAKVNEAPLSPVEIQSIILPTIFLKEWKDSWISFKEQGWMEPSWYWTGVCVHIFMQYMCEYREGFFYIIWLHWDPSEKAAPLTSPWLPPWPGNAATSVPPELPNPSWSTVPSLFWSRAASGHEEDLTLARTWQNFCTNFQLNLYLARRHMPEGNTLAKKKISEWLRLGGTFMIISFQLPCHG